MNKQVISIGIGAILIVMIVLLIIFIPETKEEPLPDTSKSISPSQAYQICDSDSCPTEEVMIKGKMEYGYMISDEDKTVLLKFGPG